MKHTSTKKIFIGSLALFFVFAAGYAGALVFTLRSIGEAARLSAELYSVRERGDDTFFLKRFERRFEGGAGVLDEHLVYADNVVAFIDHVEGLQKAAGVSVSLRDLRETGNDQLSFEMHAEGSFPGLIRFVSLVEALPYIISVKKASFAKTASGWTGSLSAELVGFMK